MLNFSLTKRYIPAITLLVIFIVFSHILINNMVNSNKEFAKIINISGKQRMLSQRLIILAQDYYEDNARKPALQEALDEIKASHKYLLTRTITKELKRIYFEKSLNGDLKIYLKHFDNLLVLNNPMFIKSAREESKAILKKLDCAVKEYERHSREKLNDASKLEFNLMIATLLILFLEVLFIFKPASKRIDENTKELVQRTEYETTVIESNNNAIIAIDWTGKITTYNNKAVEIFGWTKKEMIGTRKLLRIIPPKYKKLHINASKKYLKTGVSCGILGNVHELEGIKKDGEIFPIRITFGSKYSIKNTIVVANISDRSKEKEQSEMIIQQSKMASMGEMIENIAHQWRQPLSIISTAASGIQVEKEYGILKDEVLNTRLQNIIDHTETLSQTIEDFRSFFKPSKEMESFKINVLLRKTENIVNSAYENDGIIIVQNFDKDKDIYCVGFKNELSQVIINIFNNARDIMLRENTKEKIIKIDLTEENNNIYIKIFDSAGGISDDILPKIFDPYFTTKHKSQGTGLGLYMSSEIINNHFNGYLNATNQEFMVDDKKYNGACFNITIPTKV
ncbi:MAG: histidine kinase [Epsilonproteobacteria bacterium]|nr:MAG: histidine kinase [Campylobacterota bacterium]